MGKLARGQSMEAMMKTVRAGNGHAITQPAVDKDFEVKGQILNMITHQCQFRGTPKEDAFEHLRNFKSICNLFKIKDVAATVIYLRVFPWSLKDDSKDWLESLPKGEIDSWTTMEDKFLQRFFPALKAVKLQGDINHFVQKSNETLYDAWTRFGGSLMKKTPDEAYEIISETATHSFDWHQEMEVSRSSHVYSTETSYELTSVKAQLATFKRQMESMTKEMHVIRFGCELCQGPHLMKDCDQATMEEQTNYLGYVKKGDFALSEFPGGRQFFNQVGNTSGTNYQNGNQDGELTKQQVRSQQASIQNLERDVGRIAQSLSERPPGTLPSNTKSNSNNKGPVRNEQVNAITTRSGLVIYEETPKSPPVFSPVVPPNVFLVPINEEAKKDESKDDEPKVQEQKNDDPPEITAKPPLKLYKAPVPYPKALKKDKLATQYQRFLDMINQISVNMPLAEVIKGMPNYGKFLKDLISSKGKYQEVSTTFLNEACSAILQKQKLPPKLGDPGSFIIPCLLGDSVVYDALADLGASVNLMPYSLYLKLSLGDLKPTRMGIRLANHSFDTPIGITEDLIVKVNNPCPNREPLVFPANFVVLEMKEDTKVPIILGRPFLNTVHAIIHVQQNTLSIGMGDERVFCPVDKAMKQPKSTDDDTFFQLDIIDLCVEHDLQELLEVDTTGFVPMDESDEFDLDAEFESFMKVDTDDELSDEEDSKE
ncbi:uncharacterized protein [Rutidosis leptorrhynchoides]|uniref:uncharacterized protein n=1 Tax=Rutidosis leptorrhynchoides TaxID=125765 RepID=UPI003A99396A